MPIIRVGVVGAGYISELHLGALARIESVQAAAICDVVHARAKAKGAQHGITAYTDVSQMVRAEQLDAVHVTTPAHTHAAVVRELLELGVDVLVEKPFASDSDAAPSSPDWVPGSAGSCGSLPQHVLRRPVRSRCWIMFDPAGWGASTTSTCSVSGRSVRSVSARTLVGCSRTREIR